MKVELIVQRVAAERLKVGQEFWLRGQVGSKHVYVCMGRDGDLVKAYQKGLPQHTIRMTPDCVVLQEPFANLS